MKMGPSGKKPFCQYLQMQLCCCMGSLDQNELERCILRGRRDSIQSRGSEERLLRPLGLLPSVQRSLAPRNVIRYPFAGGFQCSYLEIAFANSLEEVRFWTNDIPMHLELTSTTYNSKI